MQVFTGTRLTIMSRPLISCLETIYMASFADPITSKVWCYLPIFISPPLFNMFLRQCWWPIAVVVVALSWCVLSTVQLPLHSNLNLLCTLLFLMIFVFSKPLAKLVETLIKTRYMLLWASPWPMILAIYLLHNLMLKRLQLSSHCCITIWWVNTVVAGVLFQCCYLPGPYPCGIWTMTLTQISI